MTNSLKLAVVGVGRMGSYHARVAAAIPQIEVVAVADSHAERSSAIAAEVGATGHSTIEALLSRGDIEAWLIASSTPTHPELVAAALEHGLHVLCEKPLALDPDESARLGLLASESGVTLQVGFWRRFSPPWMTAKQLLDEGAIGRPLMVRLSQWDADPPPPEFCDPDVSGGLAIDCGIHEFDLVEWLTGLEVESVSARALPLVDHALGAAGDVDNLVAMLNLSGGAVATIDLSRNCRYGDDVRTEILGEQGALFIDLLPKGRTRLATAAGTAVVPGSETDDAMLAGVRRQAESFVRSVRGDVISIPDAQTSTRALVAARAAQQSMDSGATVRVWSSPDVQS